MPDSVPKVFFDSFGGSGAGESWRFSGYAGTIEALSAGQVAGALQSLQESTASGLYAAGFVCYEAATGLNPDLPSLPPVEGVPLVWFALFRERTSVPAGAGLPEARTAEIRLYPSLAADAHAAAIDRIHSYISAGDSYQVNYTFKLEGDYNGDPLALYTGVGRSQRAGYCSYLDFGRFAIISASPELFFSLQEGGITTRPMKGTARRGRWPAEDHEAVRELRNSSKERAENLMIVDLLRNDLGIVAGTGTVRAGALFEVETYPTVHQMTSTVTATIREGVGLTDIFRALFPCGSITGAPKKRSMEIIAGLEGKPRGVYCGAIGCVAPGGEAVFSVAIRTLLLDRRSGRISLGIGSGITWDSTAGREYAECLDKGAFINGAGMNFQLIESLRLQDGNYSLLERHLLRMEESAAYFGFEFDRELALRTLLEYAAGEPGLCKVRLLLASDGALRITSEPLADSDTPLRLAIASIPVDSGDPLRYHKTTRRELLDNARLEQNGADEVLFVNQRGELTEGSYHTLIVDLEGNLLTPPLSCGVLPGVLRQELIENGKISERVVMPADLLQAKEVWLINSVRGWRRAVLIPGETSP